MDQGGASKRLSSAARRQAVRTRIAACLWAAVATASVAAAALTAAGDRGRERIAGLFDRAPPSFAQRITDQIGAEDVTKLSAHLVKLRSEMRLLALENEALAYKVARIESDFVPIATASLTDMPEDLPRRENLPRQVYPALPDAEERGQAAPAGGRYALEIGSGKDVGELKELWVQLSEQHGELFEALEPKFRLVTDEHGEHRLLLRAGPLATVGEAASACAAMRRDGTACSPASDRGEALVMQ